MICCSYDASGLRRSDLVHERRFERRIIRGDEDSTAPQLGGTCHLPDEVRVETEVGMELRVNVAVKGFNRDVNATP
jgi:hypothetical protein